MNRCWEVIEKQSRKCFQCFFHKYQVAAAEAKALTELNQSVNELRERMNAEREQALEEARLVMY